MLTWTGLAVILAALLAGGGALYVRLRWRRSPRAYRAMFALAACYFVAGALATVWVMRITAPKPATGAAPSAAVVPMIPAPAASAAAAAAAQLANPLNHFSAKVVSITDGDTVDVLAPGNLTYAVRLAGIDAPEHDQAFGAQSTQHLSDLISGKTVTLDCENERSYGRLICKILLPNGEDACLDQVKAGMAWHYKQYEDDQGADDRHAYSVAECAAMKSKTGLWSEAHPIQPQDYRHATNSQMLFDAQGCRISSEPTNGVVRGNARSHIFEWPGCPYYDAISPDNRVPFPSPQVAEAAGYRPAHNSP
jgi:endonuclease YncB( thermonuclease family)